MSLAPIVEGYAAIGERTVELVGIDPFASPQFDDGAAERATPQFDGRLAELARWFAPGGAVLMAASTARELQLVPGQALSLDVAGTRAAPATLRRWRRRDPAMSRCS